MSFIFNEILFRPLLNALIFLYQNFPGHDFGVAIIILTVIIRFILYPFNQKFIKSQRAISIIQPRIKEIQQKYKEDKQRQAQEMLALYKQYKVNPLSGFLAIIIQIPILIALFKVLKVGLDPQALDGLYSFVSRPGSINPMFLGLFDLSVGSGILAIAAGFFQFIQSKMLQPAAESGSHKKPSMASMMGKQMTYVMPVFITYVAWKLPAGVALYWTINTIFGIIQQYLSKKKTKNQEALKNSYEPK